MDTLLTNKEASTVLCSVVKHAGSGRARKKCRGKQSRLLYLFYDKESDNFPTHSAEFSDQTLFSKRVKVASAVYCSLIKHATISQSQSLLELFK